MADRVPDVLVELLALGELEEPEASEVRAALDATHDSRLEAIARDNAAILALYPVEEVVPAITAALRPQSRVVWISAVVVALAAATLVWILQPSTSPPRDEVVAAREPEGGIRHKSAMTLLIHREGEDLPLQDGDDVSAGDLLQLSYRSGGKRHGAIVSVDGSGAVTLHWPPEGENTALGEGTVELDHAFELDDAPDFEWFFFVAANEPLDLDAVLSAARRFGQAPSDRGLEGPWQEVRLRLDKR